MFDNPGVLSVGWEIYWSENELVRNPAPDTPIMLTVTEPEVEKNAGGITSRHKTQLYKGALLIADVS